MTMKCDCASMEPNTSLCVILVLRYCFLVPLHLLQKHLLTQMKEDEFNENQTHGFFLSGIFVELGSKVLENLVFDGG